MIANAAGVISAAPSPCAVRAPINTPAVDAKPLTNDAVVNTVRPVSRTRRRDSRSAIRPPSSSPPPDIKRYAVTTHCRSPLLSCRSAPMVGKCGVDHRNVQHHQHLGDQGQGEDGPGLSMRIGFVLTVVIVGVVIVAVVIVAVVIAGVGMLLRSCDGLLDGFGGVHDVPPIRSMGMTLAPFTLTCRGGASRR